MRFEIVPMLESDLADVVDIEEQTGLNRWGYEAYRRELLSNPNAIMLVARPVKGDLPRIAGFVASALIYDELHINNLATHPEFRRKGIGRRLLEKAIAGGRRRGAAFCVLEVRSSNESAQQLYYSVGFATTRVRKEYYRGPTEDALEMVLPLRDGDTDH
ncbi:MAG TPA: ribosomal protein S18-alanine N-acetyltransferase [Blastocatellia bacterium]|nr:ribosomal protein S18-alanine N-acetyltransferase [Blastocatellia bacterium]